MVLNLQEMHSIFTQKLIFFQGGMPPTPFSYNMSDVNPHLTQCEPPPYIKAGSAPDTIQEAIKLLSLSVHPVSHQFQDL